MDLSQVALPYDLYLNLSTKQNESALPFQGRVRDLRVILRMLATAAKRPTLCTVHAPDNLGALLSDAYSAADVHAALFQSAPSINAITIEANDNILVPQEADTVTTLDLRDLRRVVPLKFESCFVVPPDPCHPVPLSTTLTVRFAPPFDRACLTLSIVHGNAQARKLRCILEGTTGQRTVLTGVLPDASTSILTRLFAPMNVYRHPDLSQLPCNPIKKPTKTNQNVWLLDILNEQRLGLILEEAFRLHVLAVAATAENTTRIFALSNARLTRMPPSKGNPACHSLSAYVHDVSGKCWCAAHQLNPKTKPLGVEARFRFCGHVVDPGTKECPIHKSNTVVSAKFPTVCIGNPTAAVVCRHEPVTTASGEFKHYEESLYTGLDIKAWPMIVDLVVGMRLYCSECTDDAGGSDRRAQISATIIELMEDIRMERTARGICGDKADESDRRCVHLLRKDLAFQTSKKRKVKILDNESGRALKKCQCVPVDPYARLLRYRKL